MGTWVWVLAWVVAVGGCRTQNDNLRQLGFEACYLEDISTVKVCSCPFDSCSYKGSSLAGECVITDEGVVFAAVMVLVFVLCIVMIAWLLCCKGRGCSVTHPCEGGCCLHQPSSIEQGKEAQLGNLSPIPTAE